MSARAELAEALVLAMTAFDPSIATHLCATASWCQRIAQQIELDHDEVENCRLAGLLHDVGMLSVDPWTLRQPEMLSAIEQEMLERHPEAGARIVAGIPALKHLAPIVRAHHERMDGTGYPDRRPGYEIPLASRIVAVADAFHTMTSPVVYRVMFSPAAALAELVGNTGSQFDADVVDALGRLLRLVQAPQRRRGSRSH